MRSLEKQWICIFSISFLFFMPINKIIAATDKIDSLKQLIISKPGEKETVDNLLEIIKYFMDINKYDSATHYAGQAMTLSMSLEYREGIAESNYKYYLIENRKGNHNEALKYIMTFNKICEENEDNFRLGKGYYSYGSLLGKMGKSDSAIYLLKKSLNINRLINDTTRLIANNNGIGNIFNDLSEFDSAAFYFLEAAQLAESSGALKYLGPIYNNIGRTFTRMKDYDRARQYLELSLEINEKNNNSHYIIQNFQNISSNELQSGNPEKAMAALDRAADILKSNEDNIETANLYNNYAAIYQKQEKYELALENYKKALRLFTKQNYAEGTSMAMKNIGEIYNLLKKYEPAKLMLDSALKIATEAGYLQNRRLVLQDLAFNYSDMGDYKNAYKYFYMYHYLYDSLLNVDKVKTVNDLEKKYHKEKDEARILSLEKENLKKTIQRNVILYTGSAILSLALFTLLFLRQRAHKDRIIAQHKIKQLEEEKKLMSARLLVEGQEQERKRIARELHDGLGVLLSAARMQFTSIKDLSAENKPLMERAAQLLEQATSDVRRVSHNMMPGLLTKLGFFEAVEDLIENIGDTKGLAASCEIEGDQDRLPENKEIMLYRVVQEMVNNTLKHAKAKNISLKIKRLDNHLEIIYSDDGTGFDPDKLSEGSRASIGLQSIQSRIDFLGGKLEIESSPGSGVKYTLQIPL